MATENEFSEIVPRKKPFHLSYLLAGINILVFIVMMLMDSHNGVLNQVRFGAKVNYLIVDGQYYRLLTAMFLHADFMHIIFNMMALLNIGVSIEYIFGKTRFLAIYFISGLVASMGSFLFNDHVSVGASGAIFGLLGAFLFFSVHHKGEGAKLYRTDTLTIIGVNLLYGFFTPSIDNSAHIFGLIAGYISCWAVLRLEIPSWAKYARVLSVLTLAAFMIYGTTLGFANYKDSESYYYNKGVLSWQMGQHQLSVDTFKAGLKKHPSQRIQQIVDELSKAGYPMN